MQTETAQWCSQSSRFPTAGQGERSSENEIEIWREVRESQTSGVGPGQRPELSIPAAGQKDRRLWGQECPAEKLFETTFIIMYALGFPSILLDVWINRRANVELKILLVRL